MNVLCACTLLNKLYVQARINVPAPSVRTLQRGIAASSFTTDASIQVSNLHLGL